MDNIYHLKDGDSTGSHWYAEYTQGGKKAYVQVDGDGDGKIHVYATWGILKHYADGPPSGATTSNKANWTDGTKYTNVALVPGSSNKLKDFTGVINGAFTIRAKVINRETIDSYKLLSEEKCILSNDLIIDNVSMQYQSGKAGATTNINANSKVLIIGDGINSVKTAGVDKSGVYYGQFATIYGGKVGNNKMIIHSGTYSCIYGGGMTGCTSVTIMNGGVVLDTLGGGNPSGETTDTGKLYLYLTGLTAYSDTYTDYLLNHENEGTKVTGANCISSSRLIGESSMVVGGNGNNCASDSTYVYLTGTSDVWTIQAAGREKNSVVKGDANMEISGKAIVRNVACGCITDAKPSSDTSTDASNIKGNVNLKVRDDVYIASLVGGGYDTYLISKGACFQGSSRSINIDIDGGNIGYVYGGGLRGPIGTKYNPTNININIKGGNIVNDVYGGGSGTLVKIKHKNTNGSVEINDAYGDPTGLAYVYGNITVNMSGGVVNGGVYGGGKSVAVVDTYGGTVIKDKSGNTYFQENVAMVDGNVIVNISGGEVKGDVFGAGKGIDTTKLTTQDAIESEYSSLYVIRNKNFTSTAGLQNSNNLVKSDVSISSDLEFAYIPWAFQNLNNNKKVQVTFKLDDDKYAEFAKVVGNTNVNIYSDCTIRGSVYGGGALGKLYGGTNVHITEGTVIGTVYGGGLGTVGKVSVMGKRKITIGGTANIKGSVYGGSALGTDGLTEGDGVVPYYSGSYNGAYDAIIYLKAGTVDGSIFGGGFQGITNGDTHIFVGANSLELKDVGVLGD